MRNIKSVLVTLCLAAAFSCSKPHVQDENLEVNRNNISGEWVLSLWNGSPLAEGTYFNMTLVRNDATFTITQNMDAFPESPREITGRFDLAADEVYGTVISGVYDHDAGFWSHDYAITRLTSKEMEWVAVDDEDFVQLFLRP